MMDFKAFVDSANEENAEAAPKTGAPSAADSNQVSGEADAPSMWSTVGAVSAISGGTRAVARRAANPDQATSGASAPSSATAAQDSVQSSLAFPVGWLVVVAGHGRGGCLTLQKGVSRIDQTEAGTFTLATAASERSLATVVYDAEKNKFFAGEPDDVFPTEPLNDGDILNIGNASLRFVALCNASFDWTSETEIAQ